MRRSIRFIFRGELREIAAFDPATTLLEWLREEMHATGTKEGCNEGDCGACTVVLARADGERIRHDPVNACILLLGQIDGTEVLTIEDLGMAGAKSGEVGAGSPALAARIKSASLHPIQAAMVRHHASQCGFCTPGIVMSLFAAYHEAERPVSRETINDCLAGNLCRCTGYRPIIDAAGEALTGPAEDHFALERVGRLATLQALADQRDVVIGNTEQFFALPYHLDTLSELSATHPEATIIAGATDAGLWVTKKLVNLTKVIALSRVAGLDAIVEGEDALFLGAGVTLARALPFLAKIDPDMETLMRRFGSAQVRASGTVGGNIANGSPIGDLAPALIALGASLHLRLREATRDLPLEDFFLDYGRQDRAPGEIITGLTIPLMTPGRHFRAFKISKRYDEDISALMGAFRITLEGQVISEARIAFGGMAGTPRRGRETEIALIGAAIDQPQGWMAAVQALEADFQPISDMRASAAYRARVARALLGKALTEIAGTRSMTRIHPREPAAEALHE
jgi:xanthine dehydrogenase small subunit